MVPWQELRAPSTGGPGVRSLLGELWPNSKDPACHSEDWRRCVLQLRPSAVKYVNINRSIFKKIQKHFLRNWKTTAVFSGNELRNRGEAAMTSTHVETQASSSLSATSAALWGCARCTCNHGRDQTGVSATECHTTGSNTQEEQFPVKYSFLVEET